MSIGLWDTENLVDESGNTLVDENGHPLFSYVLSYAIMMEFGGVGLGWTNVTADQRLEVSIQVRYGISGSSPLDRVADTGSLTFALDNGESNSGGLLGYYAPGNANCRSGFDTGIRARFEIQYGGMCYYKFIGTLDQIIPTPGKFRERLTYCVVVDWMDEAARHNLDLLAVQANQRADELIETILGNMTRQPAAKSLATGQDTFPYALDQARDEKTTSLAEFQKIMQSELGFLFVKGDTSQGGTLVFQDRQARPVLTLPQSTLANTMTEMSATRSRPNVINRILTIVHPRQVSGSNVVLWNLQSIPLVKAGTLLMFTASYRDPDQRASRVGAQSIVTPAATTDYTMNSLANGTGTNLTANFSVSVTAGGNSAEITVTNNGITDGYITLLQLRGIGIFSYEPITATAEDAASKIAYGLSVLAFDMPEQNEVAVATDAGNYMLAQWKDTKTLVDRIVFIGNVDSARMTAGLAREPGERARITESATGVDQDYFVNGCEIVVDAQGLVIFAWLVTPADYQTYFILGFSMLGTTTVLGY